MLQTLRILVVDDQGSMRALVMSALRAMGVRTLMEAADGLEALDVLHRKGADLVLLDAEMPKLDGVSVLRTIRGDPTLSAVKVIMMTGRADAEFVQSIARLGVDGYLAKPVSAAALNARVSQAFRGRA